MHNTLSNSTSSTTTTTIFNSVGIILRFILLCSEERVGAWDCFRQTAFSTKCCTSVKASFVHGSGQVSESVPLGSHVNVSSSLENSKVSGLKFV